MARCRHVTGALCQYFVVLSADEALYCKLMELMGKGRIKKFLILRLGGCHTSMNLLNVIGKHVESSGLLHAFVESKPQNNRPGSVDNHHATITGSH